MPVRIDIVAASNAERKISRYAHVIKEGPQTREGSDDDLFGRVPTGGYVWQDETRLRLREKIHSGRHMHENSRSQV